MSDELIQEAEAFDINDIEFSIIPSSQSKTAGAHVGVQAKHLALNIIVQSTSHPTQYQNKVAAIALLEKGKSSNF